MVINYNELVEHGQPLNTEGQTLEGAIMKSKIPAADQRRNKGTKSALIVLSAGKEDKNDCFGTNESKTLSDKQSLSQSRDDAKNGVNQLREENFQKYMRTVLIT